VLKSKNIERDEFFDFASTKIYPRGGVVWYSCFFCARFMRKKQQETTRRQDPEAVISTKQNQNHEIKTLDATSRKKRSAGMTKNSGENMSWLINAEQLDKFRKSQKSLIIFDASLHLGDENHRNAQQEFTEKHIPDAKFFDIELFSDPNTDLPHMLIQDEKLISEKLSALGVRNDYKIIFYDNSTLRTSCRALWMMKMFGHNPFQLYILDGGLNAWIQYNNKTESGAPNYSPKQYTATFQSQFIRTLSQMKENVKHPKEQVVDVRHSIRFIGGKEPRPGLRAGHIPGSFCFPFFTMFDRDTQLWKPLDKIRRQLKGISLDLNYPIISTCGSAITAPILDFALDLLEHKNHSVYDGSWTEWGAEKLYSGEIDLSERPVETCLEN